MKLIYHERIGDRTVKVFYPKYPDDDADVPALIQLITPEKIEWNSSFLTKEHVIRKAIELLDGSFEERACEYCREMGWQSPK